MKLDSVVSVRKQRIEVVIGRTKIMKNGNDSLRTD
jgi:hypothetical protein